MFIRSLAFFSVLVVASSVVRGDDGVRKYTIEQFLKTVNYRGVSFSPNYDKLLVSSDETGVFNAYEITIESGALKPLTASTTNSIFTVGYFPTDERFLYTSDEGGNELNHLYVRLEDGTSQDLTPGERLKAQFLGWSHDDAKFYVGSNERDQRYFDVFEYDVATLDRELIFKNEEGYNFADITPDGKTLALTKTNTRNDSDIYLFHRDGGAPVHITPHEGDVNHYVACFSPDGKSLYVITDRDSDFLYLVRRGMNDDEAEVVVKKDWDVSFAGFSKHGKYLVVGINEDAKTKIEVFDGATMQPLELPSIEGANIDSYGISRNEAHVAFYASSSKMPGDLFYASLDEAGAPKKLTRSLNPEIRSDDLVEGKVVRFESFDGLEIPGVLYLPKTATEDSKVPAVVWVHGGPGGQSRIGYIGLMQYLVNHGYALFAINNRGSSGYGKEFETLDNRNHGKNDLLDCVSSKEMLIKTGLIAPEQIGIIGGSYGGYMTLAALTFQPDEFEVGIDIFGISNWYRTVQNIPPWWEAQRKALENEMGDFSDEAYFKSISPLFHSDQIKKPLMVLQGANDPRVLKVESDEIVEAVKNNGIPVEYLVFDDEGHGFRKKENQLAAYRSILSFLDKHLKQSEVE